MSPFQTHTALLLPHLKRCGYGSAQLATPFLFDDITVPIAAFAGKPWDSWSACIAVVDAKSDSRQAALRVGGLGAATVFACSAQGIDWWAMGPAGPAQSRPIRWRDVGAVFDRHREELRPDRIYGAKLRKPGTWESQLWFFDAGLMPAVERNRGQTLLRLIENTIKDLRRELGAMLRTRQAQEDVYRTVFWLLAAKVLHDKAAPNFVKIDLADIDQVFERVGKHHGDTNRLPPFGRPGRAAIDAAAQRIASCGSLADVSSESIAFVYENALIDNTAGGRKGAAYDIRKELGIHGTPSALIHHMLAQLWPLIEDIAHAQRHVFEPACGHAPFLTAAMRWLRDWGSSGHSESTHDYLRTHLHGLEADPFAMELAKLSLTLADEPYGNRWDIMPGDMFAPGALAKEVRRTRILLSNPPYERFSPQQKAHYRRLGAPVSAQTKAVEMLKRVLPKLEPGSVFGVVVPQGVLHDRESEPIREFLVEQCELTEISVFADNLFEHGDHEVAVVLGRRSLGRTKAVTFSYRRVRERGMDAFKERLAFSSEREVAQGRFFVEPHLALQLPDLLEIWEYLQAAPRLEKSTEIEKGFEFVADAQLRGREVVSNSRRSGWMKALLRAADDYAIWRLPKAAYVDLSSRNVRRRGAARKIDVPQVVLNYAPVAREPWRLKAAVDADGVVLSSRFIAFRPKPGGPSLRVLWAVLNSPVANAYAYCYSGKRETLVKEWRAFPLPVISPERASAIEGAAEAYLTAIDDSESGFMRLPDTPPKEAVRRALLALDAEILKLYDLPPRLERQLLDLFTGVERKGVGCDFCGYYPPGFTSLLPLHVLISDNFTRAAADGVARRFAPGESTYVRKALAAAADERGAG